ncbi:Mur ligase family protein, partial [Arcobacteraceae bacterium]|nr:Mur ligase family protein [Arcobacteraceae bacterium]
MRILGRGKTALSIKKIYPNASLYDDSNESEYDIKSDELTVVSPGIPPHNTLVKNTKNLISEYDLFSKEMPFSVWISGTNGKTTTTQMLQHLLNDDNSQCGGNIGYPLALMDKTKKTWILETSSFTLHYTNTAKPNIYILLPVHDDHLSWHGSFVEYEKAKLKPLELMDTNDIAIIPSKFKDFKTKAKTIFYENTQDLEKEFEI